MQRFQRLAAAAATVKELLVARIGASLHPLSTAHSSQAAWHQLSSSSRSFGVLVEYGLLPAEDELDKSVQDEVITAIPRSHSGKIISKKERTAGRCPSIVYEQKDGHLGGHKELISVDSNQIMRLVKKYGRTFFLSRTFDLEVSRQIGDREEVKKERVLPRQVHLHASKDYLLNITFLRAPPEARIKVDVPVMFIGEDACIGIRKGGYLNTIRRTVTLECPGDAIPPHVEVDLSNLNVGDKILLSDLQLGQKVRIMHRDHSLAICKIGGNKSLQEDPS